MLQRLKITAIECKEITAEKELYYGDMEYYHPKEHAISGDMGFAICDQAETRNSDSLKKNIENLKDWAFSELSLGMMDECIQILYVCKGLFYDIFDAEPEDCRSGKATKKAAKLIAERDWSDSTATRDTGKEQEIMYALALCSPAVGRRLELKKHLSRYFDTDRLHYYDPVRVSPNYIFDTTPYTEQ